MATGVRYTRNKGGVMDGTPYRQMAANLQSIIEEELADAGADGVLEARDVVETSGTNRQWDGSFRDRNGNLRSGSGSGRVDTGEMLDALDFRVIHGKSGAGLDVGWIHLWEAYFGAQDEGFDAPGYRNANQHVEGMHVISHLRHYMRGTVDAALDRVVVRMMKGL